MIDSYIFFLILVLDFGFCKVFSKFIFLIVGFGDYICGFFF